MPSPAHFDDAAARFEALLQISPELAHHRSIAELVRILADKLHLVVPFEYLALVLHDAANGQMKLTVLEPAEMPRPYTDVMPVAGGPAGRVWESQQTTVIPIPKEGKLPEALEYLRDLGQTATCWLPLTTAHARIGVLTFGSTSATDYSKGAIAFMEQVAAHVAIAVDNAINFDRARQLTAELRAERDRLQLLIEIGSLLVSHLDSAALLKAISESLRPVVRHNQVGVAVYDESVRALRVPFTYDEAGGLSRPDVVWPLDRSPAGVAFVQRAAALFDRGEIDAFAPEGITALPRTDPQTLCCLPLVTRHGAVGTLSVSSKVANAFSKSDVDLLGRIANPIAIAVENALAYRTLGDRNDQLLEEKQYLEADLAQEFGDIVGKSPALKKVLQTVKTVAPTDATVLILGETGTGKELIARAVHRLSPRSARTFVRLSAAALPTTLLESELFGYEKGAFTGAAAAKVGRLELADHGTLFLDEVGDLPLEVQPKLLRVLQEREFERLGSTRTRHADVRIIAATSRDLDRMVEDDSFRSDLFYRLNVFPIRIPPLRGARTTSRHWRATSPSASRSACRRPGRDFAADRADAAGLALARQYPRARERHRTRGDRDLGSDVVRARPRCAGEGARAGRQQIGDAARHGTRDDRPRAARLGRRGRRTVRRGGAARAETHDAPVDDAEAGHPPARLLTRFLQRHRKPGEIDARLHQVARTGEDPRFREVQVQAGAALGSRDPEVEEAIRDAVVGGRPPLTLVVAAGRQVEQNRAGRDEHLHPSGDVDGRVHAEHPVDAAVPLRHRPQRVDVNVLPPDRPGRRFVLRLRGGILLPDLRGEFAFVPLGPQAARVGDDLVVLEHASGAFGAEPRRRLRPNAAMARVNPARLPLAAPRRVPLLPLLVVADPLPHVDQALLPRRDVRKREFQIARPDDARRQRR
jgi:formate hydrogenlyase transcriptional activator